MDLFAALAGLDAAGLPRVDYAVFGSGPLAARGLREAGDVDIIVRPALWAALAARFPVTVKGDGRVIALGAVEVWDSWAPDVGPISELITTADVIRGYRFVRLERVLAWKLAAGRPKDAADVALIRAYLARG
jgi:hypothetical protein